MCRLLYTLGRLDKLNCQLLDAERTELDVLGVSGVMEAFKHASSAKRGQYKTHDALASFSSRAVRGLNNVVQTTNGRWVGKVVAASCSSTPMFDSRGSMKLPCSKNACRGSLLTFETAAHKCW